MTKHRNTVFRNKDEHIFLESEVVEAEGPGNKYDTGEMVVRREGSSHGIG